MTRNQKIILAVAIVLVMIQYLGIWIVIDRFEAMRDAHRRAVDSIPQGIADGIERAVQNLPVAKIEVEEVQPQAQAKDLKVHPWDDLKFEKKFLRYSGVEELRAMNFGVSAKHQIKIRHHKGGRTLEHDAAWETICAVIERMPNMFSTLNLKRLCYETMVTETGLGREKVETGISKWRNYGIAQFRVETAQETIDWLKAVRPDVHKAVMNLYDRKLNLKDNLSFNVPFSIGLMLQYYWRMIPDLQNNIQTVEERAEAWKAAYNSKLGLGKIRDYLERVKKHNARVDAIKQMAKL